MGVKFRKRIAIKLPEKVIIRFRDTFSTGLSSNSMTGHWQEREQVKYSSFDFSGSEEVYYTQDENGLDDYYPANFGYGQLLTPLSSIKKILLRRYLRPDALALDPIVNYKLNKYKDGILSLSDLPYLDRNNPNWSGVRAILISNLIQTFAPNFAAESILEIGPGSGNLLLCMKKLYPSATCFVVDLPSSLPFSAVNILHNYPKAKFLLPGEAVGKNNFSEYDFIFLRDDQTDLIQNNTIDISLNTVSFGEMRKNIVENYFKFLRRASKAKNLFYCLNRVEKLMEYDNSVHPIRFHEYPWQEEDEELLFQSSEIETPTTTASSMFEKLVCLSTSH